MLTLTTQPATQPTITTHHPPSATHHPPPATIPTTTTTTTDPPTSIKRNGIPTLILVDRDGRELSAQARNAVTRAVHHWPSILPSSPSTPTTPPNKHPKKKAKTKTTIRFTPCPAWSCYQVRGDDVDACLKTFDAAALAASPKEDPLEEVGKGLGLGLG